MVRSQGAGDASIVKPAATRQRANRLQPGGTALFGAANPFDRSAIEPSGSDREAVGGVGRRRDAYDARIAARPGSYPGAKDRRRSP